MKQKTVNTKPPAQPEAPLSGPQEALGEEALFGGEADAAEPSQQEALPLREQEAGPEEGSEGPHPREDEPREAEEPAGETQALPPPRRIPPPPKAYTRPAPQGRSLSYAERAAIYLSDLNEYRALTGGRKQWKQQ